MARPVWLHVLINWPRWMLRLVLCCVDPPPNPASRTAVGFAVARRIVCCTVPPGKLEFEKSPEIDGSNTTAHARWYTDYASEYVMDTLQLGSVVLVLSPSNFSSEGMMDGGRATGRHSLQSCRFLCSLAEGTCTPLLFALPSFRFRRCWPSPVCLSVCRSRGVSASGWGTTASSSHSRSR